MEYAPSVSLSLRYRLCWNFSLMSCNPSSTNSEPPALTDALAICATVVPMPLLNVAIVSLVAPCNTFDITALGATLPTPLIMKRVDAISIPVSTEAYVIAYL